MTDNIASQIMQAVAPLRKWGVRQLSNGAELIGPAKWVAPEAYVHVVFAPSPAEAIAQIQTATRIGIPGVVASFLRAMNGAVLFSDALSLFGVRHSYARSGDEARQPYDIATPNQEESLPDVPNGFFCFGGYGHDLSRLYLDPATGAVFRTPDTEFEILNEWRSIEDMVRFELSRLAAMHDEHGKISDPREPTVPR